MIPSKEEKNKQVHMLLIGQEILPDLIENGASKKIDPVNYTLKYEKGYLIIYPKDNPSDRIVISEKQLDAKKLEREAKKEHKDMYSSPTEIIQSQILSSALAETRDNQIKYDQAKIQEIANAVNMDYELVFDSLIKHEQTHISDLQRGSDETVNLSYNYAQKMDMCTEINATITQASVALKQYQQTGNIDGVKLLWNCANQQEIEDYIKKHSNDKDCKEQLGALVFKGWLEKNNKVGTDYWKNAKGNGTRPINHISDTMAGALVDNQATLNEYHKRTDEMFSKTALGDIRKYVDVDFEIAGGQPLSQSEEFLQALTNPAHNTYQATKRVENLFKEVQKADEDGIRTPEEQADINRTLARLMAEKTGRKTSQAPQNKSTKSTKTVQIQVYRGR